MNPTTTTTTTIPASNRTDVLSPSNWTLIERLSQHRAAGHAFLQQMQQRQSPSPGTGADRSSSSGQVSAGTIGAPSSAWDESEDLGSSGRGAWRTRTRSTPLGSARDERSPPRSDGLLGHPPAGRTDPLPRTPSSPIATLPIPRRLPFAPNPTGPSTSTSGSASGFTSSRFPVDWEEYWRAYQTRHRIRGSSSLPSRPSVHRRQVCVGSLEGQLKAQWIRQQERFLEDRRRARREAAAEGSGSGEGEGTRYDEEDRREVTNRIFELVLLDDRHPDELEDEQSPEEIRAQAYNAPAVAVGRRDRDRSVPSPIGSGRSTHHYDQPLSPARLGSRWVSPRRSFDEAEAREQEDDARTEVEEQVEEGLLSSLKCLGSADGWSAGARSSSRPYSISAAAVSRSLLAFDPSDVASDRRRRELEKLENGWKAQLHRGEVDRDGTPMGGVPEDDDAAEGEILLGKGRLRGFRLVSETDTDDRSSSGGSRTSTPTPDSGSSSRRSSGVTQIFVRNRGRRVYYRTRATLCPPARPGVPSTWTLELVQIGTDEAVVMIRNPLHQGSGGVPATTAGRAPAIVPIVSLTPARRRELGVVRFMPELWRHGRHIWRPTAADAADPGLVTANAASSSSTPTRAATAQEASRTRPTVADSDDDDDDEEDEDVEAEKALFETLPGVYLGRRSVPGLGMQLAAVVDERRRSVTVGTRIPVCLR